MLKNKKDEKVLITSESVSEGHPDKVCDLIADRILDACLEKDPSSHVACEVLATKNKVVLAGEITSKAKPNYEKIVRDTIKYIGYDRDSFGFNFENVEIENLIKEQSVDIYDKVCNYNDDDLGAGDQGIMFGYATNETKNYMPLSLVISHRLVEYATILRKNTTLKHACPDMKSQVSLDYSDPKHIKTDTIVLSIQHEDNINLDNFRKEVYEKVVLPVLKEFNLNEPEKVYINANGKFVIGGPYGDTGLTGRKIIVDTYGGFANHGGGAFSGKDPTKVDRSASYLARYVAKNLVATKLCDKALIQLSYVIGYKDPVSIYLDTFNTEKVDRNILLEAIKNVFQFTPFSIIKNLHLNDNTFKYQDLTNYGHFGKDNFPFEKLDKVNQILEFVRKNNK